MTDIDLPTLIRELGLDPSRDNFEQLRTYCFEKVDRWVREHGGVATEGALLQLLCDKVSVQIEVIERDDDPAEIASRYFDQGDPALAQVRSHDWRRTYGLCFIRHNRTPWDRWFVAVIDARGRKASRAYFSKWHELVHALSWPPQLRLAYRENLVDGKPPLEQAVDKIAAQLAFYEPIFGPAFARNLGACERPSFDCIASLQAEAAPEASMQSVAINCVTRAETPMLFLVAKPALKPSERRKLEDGQGSLFESDESVPRKCFRAVQVVSNDAARAAGLFIPENFRVPADSVIRRVQEPGLATAGQSAQEDLSWWESAGRPRPSFPILVEARSMGQVVYALVSATDTKAA